MGEEIKLIPMALIDGPVKIARETIDPERVRELAESIREHGLKQAILVRPVNGRYEIVYGHRRYLAHRLLGLTEIKSTVEELDDKQTVIVRGLENLQRENLTPSEEAAHYVALRDEGGLGVLAICRKTGKSPQTIKRYMDFAKHPVEVRRAVDEKKISLNTLEVLVEIDDPASFKYYFDNAAQNGITEKVARMWVDDYVKTRAGNYLEHLEGGPDRDIEIVVKPVYMPCELCMDPVDLKVIKHLLICGGCLRALRELKRDKPGLGKDERR